MAGATFNYRANYSMEKALILLQLYFYEAISMLLMRLSVQLFTICNVRSDRTEMSCRYTEIQGALMPFAAPMEPGEAAVPMRDCADDMLTRCSPLAILEDGRRQGRFGTAATLGKEILRERRGNENAFI